VELEQLGLKIMYLVGRAHLTGGKRWTVNEISRELELPGIAVAKMARALERAGLVMVTDDDEVLCARDISRITVYEILDLARNQRSGHIAPRNTAVPAVDRLTASLDEQRRERCGELTLRDLVDESARSAPGTA
jgi:DNA-binding IscR family transcriptional regulator